MNDENTSKPEVRALISAIKETGISTAKILTLQDEEFIKTGAGMIDVVPTWWWLLSERTVG